MKKLLVLVVSTLITVSTLAIASDRTTITTGVGLQKASQKQILVAASTPKKADEKAKGKRV